VLKLRYDLADELMRKNIFKLCEMEISVLCINYAWGSENNCSVDDNRMGWWCAQQFMRECYLTRGV
jgi:hypothetical protein